MAACVLHVPLQVAVQFLPVLLGEPTLALVIAISKIMSLTSGYEIESRVGVGNHGADVPVPVQGRRVCGVSRFDKPLHRIAEEDFVGCAEEIATLECPIEMGLEWGGDGPRKGRGQEGKNNYDEGGDLHCRCV